MRIQKSFRKLNWTRQRYLLLLLGVTLVIGAYEIRLHVSDQALFCAMKSNDVTMKSND